MTLIQRAPFRWDLDLKKTHADNGWIEDVFDAPKGGGYYCKVCLISLHDIYNKKLYEKVRTANHFPFSDRPRIHLYTLEHFENLKHQKPLIKSKSLIKSKDFDFDSGGLLMAESGVLRNPKINTVLLSFD